MKPDRTGCLKDVTAGLLVINLNTGPCRVGILPLSNPYPARAAKHRGRPSGSVGGGGHG